MVPPFIIDQGAKATKRNRDHSSYTPAVLKTCKELYNLKCQYTKKRNKITIIKRLSKQPEDDPAGVRWINSGLIGFTYGMKKIEAEVDTT